MFCAIWYHLYNLKTVKNTLGGVLLFHCSQGVFHGYCFTLTTLGILHYLWSADVPKNFSRLLFIKLFSIIIYLFPILFSIGFARGKVWGYLRIAYYRHSLTLRPTNSNFGFYQSLSSSDSCKLLTLHTK